MKTSSDKMLMAYAIGVAYPEHKDSGVKNVELGDINPEWTNYVMFGNGHSDSNDTYSIYYRGIHGREHNFVRIIAIPEGWHLNHTVAMFISAIEMHKSEMKNKT